MVRRQERQSFTLWAILVFVMMAVLMIDVLIFPGALVRPQLVRRQSADGDGSGAYRDQGTTLEPPGTVSRQLTDDLGADETNVAELAAADVAAATRAPLSAEPRGPAVPKERGGSDQPLQRDPVWPFEPPPFPYVPDPKTPDAQFTSKGYQTPEPRSPRAAAGPVLDSSRFEFDAASLDGKGTFQKLDEWYFRLDKSLLHGTGVATNVACGETVTIGLDLRDGQGRPVNVLMPDLLGPWMEVRISGPASTMHYMQAVSRDGEPGRFEVDYSLPMNGKHTVEINCGNGFKPRAIGVFQSVTFTVDVTGTCPAPPTRRCTAAEGLVAKDDGFWTKDDRYHRRDCFIPDFSRDQVHDILNGTSLYVIGSSYARILYRSFMSLLESRDWSDKEEEETRGRPFVKKADFAALGVAPNPKFGDRRSHYTECKGPDSCDVQSWQYRDLRDNNMPDFPLPTAERLMFVNEDVVHNCLYHGKQPPLHPWDAEGKAKMQTFIADETRRYKWYCLDAQLSLAGRLGGAGRYFFFPVPAHLARRKVKYLTQQLSAYLANSVAHDYWQHDHPGQATMIDAFSLFRSAPAHLIAAKDGHHYDVSVNAAVASALLNYIEQVDI